MSKSVLVPALIAAVLIAPAALHAQTAAAHTDTGLHWPLIDVADFAPTPDRLDLDNAAAATDGPIKTVVDHRFAQDGLVGSVGYVCVPDGHPLDGSDAGLDKTARFGRQDELIGAALNFGFR